MSEDLLTLAYVQEIPNGEVQHWRLDLDQLAGL
jgi:hypothetical protein